MPDQPDQHRCDTPATGLPGEAWICPECGTEWWADEDDEADVDGMGVFIEWRVS